MLVVLLSVLSNRKNTTGWPARVFVCLLRPPPHQADKTTKIKRTNSHEFYRNEFTLTARLAISRRGCSNSSKTPRTRCFRSSWSALPPYHREDGNHAHHRPLQEWR